MTEDEKWALIPGYGGHYSVSNAGRVRTEVATRKAPVGYVYKQSIDTRRYCQVNLIKPDGTRSAQLVHRLVMAAFVGERPRTVQVNHKDGNKVNNVLSNLEYVTQSQNMQHAKRLGLSRNDYVAGSKHPLHKLTESDVLVIKRVGYSETGEVLAKRYGVSKTLINRIRSGHTWKHVTVTETI